MTGYPAGWDANIGLGMPPEYMIPSPTGQPSTSASQPMNLLVFVGFWPILEYEMTRDACCAYSFS